MKKSLKLIAILAMATTLLCACSSGIKNSGSSSSVETIAPAEITWAFPTLGPVPTDKQLIEDEINKITTKEINVKVKLQPISIGNWFQQSNLMITGGEKLDIMPTLGNYNTLVSQKQLIDITDLINKYGQGIKTAVGDNFLKGTTVNGKIYGVANVNGKAGVPSILMRKDILDKYGLSIDSVKTLADIEKIFDVVSKGEKNMAMIVPVNQGSVTTIYAGGLVGEPKFDNLGDNFGVIFGNDNYKVVNLFESDQYKNLTNTMRSWYLKGYILKDAATITDTPQSLIKAGKGFAQFTQSEIGADTNASRDIGFPIVQKKMQDPLITTSAINNITWAIPVTCKNPEATMKFMNLLYTNAAIVNLTDWGIEGKHYVKGTDGTIGYPKDVDATTTGYNPGIDWLVGSQFLANVWQGNKPENNKILENDNKTAPISNVLGFAFDSTKVKTELANVNNVYKQYAPGLDTGSVDPAKILPQFISKLKSAGINKIIEEKQTQLDAWAKANKK